MYQAIDKEKIIQFVRTKGPVIPKDLVKSFGSDTFMTGAALSELVANGKLLITTVKIGGSPFYYLPEQKTRLQELSKHLNEKDIKAYNLLKEKKVLKDNELTPLLRVSLRYIPDYARPLQVTVDNSTELFWGWYLLAQEECVALIQQHLMLKQPKDEIQKEIRQELNSEKPPAQKTILKESLLTEAHEPVKETVKTKPEQIKINKERIETVNREKETISSITDEEKDNLEKDIENIKRKQPVSGISESSIPSNIKEIKEQQSLQSLTQPLTNIKYDNIKDELFSKLKTYFNQNNITFSDVEIIKKNKEIDCLAEVPSPVGKIEYLCKIKTKKKCNEGDLASAYVKGQKKNLPVLFITTGEVTKKAQSILTAEFKNMKLVFL
ncbi:hypothetical protein HY636_02180 [Candidatus Woesearchaeota archaeon]|nr:hypothetical protein [Candidatus Woesearchaeota archaeon]